MEPRVADLRPRGAERLAVEVRQVGRAIKAFFTASGANPLGKLGDQFKRPHERAFDITPDVVQFLNRQADENRVEILFGLERKDDAPLLVTRVELERLGLDVAPVTEVVAENRRQVVVHRCVNRTSEAGIAAVGTDGDRCARLTSLPFGPRPRMPTSRRRPRRVADCWAEC